MRHRRWVVVLAILIIAVLPLTFLGLKVGSRHPAVKRAVLGRIMPEVAGELTVGGLEMGLASLRFTDIMLRFEDGGYVLVPQATATVSLPKLIAGGLVPQRSLSSVIISDPRIMIYYGHDPADVEPAGPPFDVSSLESYLPDYLGISGAAISFRDARTDRTLTIDSIDLLLERDGEGPVVGRASGNCLGGERNFQATFTWDNALEMLAVDGTLSDARLDERLPVPPSVPVELRSGSLSAAFHASVSPDTVRGLDLGFDVVDGVVVMTAVGETLGGIQASGRLRGGVVTLESAGGTWRSASWSASGATSDRGVMEDVRLEARDLPLAPVADLLELTGARIDGRIDLSASVEGPFDSATAVVTVSSGRVGVGDIALTSLSGGATLSQGSVRLEGVDARVFGGAVSVSGALEREGPDEQWRFEFGGNARGLDVRQLMAATTGDTTGRGRVSLSEVVGGGTLDRPNLESLVTWENVSLGSVRLGSGAGGFLLSDGDLSVSLGSLDKTYAVTCRVGNLFDAPGVGGEIVLSGVSVDTLFPAVAEVLPPIALTGAIRVAGPVDSLSVRGRVALACEQA